MSIWTTISRWATRTAAVAAFAWASTSAASAADVSPPPAAVVGAAPVTVGDPGCATCQQGGKTVGTCSKCNKSLILGAMQSHKQKGPYQVNLCPGACFGYFQTQWRKWDDVCPYPYLGTGVSDAPRPPAGVLNPRPGSGGELNPPRPIEPKMTEPRKIDLPAIPTPGKF